MRQAVTGGFVLVLLGLFLVGAGPYLHVMGPQDTAVKGLQPTSGDTVAAPPPIGTPTIATISPDAHVADGVAMTVGGTNYGASRGGGNVYVGSSNATPPAESQLQSIGAWGSTSISFTLDDNALWSDGDSLYVMVVNNDPDTAVSAFGRWFDEDAPDTSAYTPIVFDTTNTSNVAVCYAATADEAALWMVEYKRGVAGTWRPGTPKWHAASTNDADTAFVTGLKDTIATALSTATLDGDTFITRFAMKDSFQHVSSTYYPDTTVFARAPLQMITFTLLPPSENGSDARVGFVAYDDTASDYMVEFAYGPSVAWLDAAAYDTMIAYSGSPSTSMADTQYTVGVNFCVTDTLFARLTKDNTAAGGSEYVVAVDTMVFDYTDIAPKSASKPGNDALLTGGILFIGDSDSLASTDGTAGSGKMSYRQLALHDWVALHMGNLKIDAANAYNNQPVADSVRSYNPDFALTFFTYWWGMDPDWSSMADTSSYRQQWDYCGDPADDGDTSFALRDVDGDIIKWAADVTQWHQNPAGFYISGADTIWYYQRYVDCWLDMLRHSGQYQDYVGLTSDLFHCRPGPADLYDANLDSVDLDGDGVAFTSDDTFYAGTVWGDINEKEAYALGAYKMAEYLKAQAWSTFLHIANGNWYDGRSDVGAIWHNVRTKMDGHNYEHANQYYPNTWTTFKQMMTEDDSTWASTLDWPILTWDEGNWTVSPLNGYYMGERILEATALAQGMYYTVRDSLQPSVTGKHWRWRFEEPDSTLFDAGVDTVANSLVWNDTDWIVSRTLKDSTTVQIHVWENESYPGYLNDGDCWHWVATDSNGSVVKQWPLTNNYFDPLTIEGFALAYEDTNASGYIVSADLDTINPQAAVRFFTWHRDSAQTDTTGMAWSDTALTHALYDTANITFPVAEADSSILFYWTHLDPDSVMKYHLQYQVDYGSWVYGDSNIAGDEDSLVLAVPRGVVTARIASVDSAYGVSAWSYLYIDTNYGGYYDHQATEIYGKLHARSDAGDIVASSTLNYILTAYPEPDTSPTIASLYPTTWIADGDSMAVIGDYFLESGGSVIVNTDDEVITTEPSQQSSITWTDDLLYFDLNDNGAWSDGDTLYAWVITTTPDTTVSTDFVRFDDAPPDTSAYTPMAFDTTNTSDVALVFAATADEAALWRVTYKNGIAGDWAPADSAWHAASTDDADTAFVTSLKDTIATGTSTASLAGDTIYTKFALKDSFQHVSSYFAPDTTIFTRATPAAGSPEYWIFSYNTNGYTLADANPADDDTLTMGDGSVYIGTVHEFNRVYGQFHMWDQYIDPEAPSAPISGTVLNVELDNDLPMLSTNTEQDWYLWCMNIKRVLTDSSVVSVDSATAFVQHASAVVCDVLSGGYLACIAVTNDTMSAWADSIIAQDPSNSIVDACYDYCDTTGSDTAWPEDLDVFTSPSDMGTASILNGDLDLTNDMWVKFEGLAAGVDDWITNNEGGFVILGDANTTGEFYRIERLAYASEAGGAKVVLRVTR